MLSSTFDDAANLTFKPVTLDTKAARRAASRCTSPLRSTSSITSPRSEAAPQSGRGAPRTSSSPPSRSQSAGDAVEVSSWSDGYRCVRRTAVRRGFGKKSQLVGHLEVGETLTTLEARVNRRGQVCAVLPSRAEPPARTRERGVAGGRD